MFAQDSGGGEFYQLYQYDIADGRTMLLTDGKSRNSGPRWARSGNQFAYTDAPGADGLNVAEGINNASQIIGLYFDESGVSHGFVLSDGI